MNIFGGWGDGKNFYSVSLRPVLVSIGYMDIKYVGKGSRNLSKKKSFVGTYMKIGGKWDLVKTTESDAVQKGSSKSSYSCSN